LIRHAVASTIQEHQIGKEIELWKQL